MNSIINFNSSNNNCTSENLNDTRKFIIYFIYNIHTVSLNSFVLKKDFSLEHLQTKRNKKSRILIVDDNDAINNFVKTILLSIFKEFNADYDIIIGTDGIDILYRIREDQYLGNLIKCIITDENMTYLNGTTTTRILKNFEKEGTIRPIHIISSTCHEDIHTTKDIYDSGVDVKISKPINKKELIKALIKFDILN